MGLFDDAPVGPDSVPDASGYDTPPSSPDLTCEVCGKPLDYAGRGRKPRFCDEHRKVSGSRSKSTSAAVTDRELTQACESLAQLYDMMVFPLFALDPVEGGAADVWMRQLESLNARNRAILANNRPLVRKINAAGEKGGNLAFILSHAVAVGPVAMVLIGHSRERAANRRAERLGTEEVPAEDAAFVDAQPMSWFGETG